MSHLQYFAYDGFGEHVRKATGYSQAVRIGDRVECAGQGGWDRTTHIIDPDTIKQLEQAFDNVEHNLKDAGAEGWKNVYAVRLYRTSLSAEELAAFVSLLKRYCPDHQPVLTGIGVMSLAFGMKIELEVSAHIPPGK